MVGCLVPVLAMYAQPVRASVEVEPAYRALLRLESYVHERSRALRDGWIFGPNLDDCYFYRTRYTDTSELLRGDGNSAQKQFAVSHGVPDLDSITNGERMALIIANYEGRRGAVRDTSQYLCIKHIPGGTRFLENTEHINEPLVYRQSWEQWQPFLEPFRRVLTAPRRVPAFMTSHACYPGIEKHLRETYPEISSWMTTDISCPSTFSPWIIQGLVRDHLHYYGPIVTDWVDMGAVNRFLLDYRKAMPARYRALSDEAVIVVLSLEAGCHLVTGIQNRLLRRGRPVKIEPLIAELVEYRVVDTTWEARVDRQFSEIYQWFFASPTVSDSSSSHPDLGISFPNKLRLVIGETIDAPEMPWVNRLSTKGFQDLWNRQGLLHSQLRAFYVAEHASLNVAELPYRSDDERVVTIDKNIDWLDGLMGNTEFRTEYDSIAWDSEPSSKAWETALERFTNEHGYSAE